MSNEDDAIIDDILNESSSSYDIKGNKNKNKNKEMSTDVRDAVGRNLTPVISREESEKITEWKNLQRINAEFKKKHGIQGYSMDDILTDGQRLIIDEDRVKERKEREKAIVDRLIEQDRKSAKAVKHTIDGKTAVFGQEVPTQ